MAVTGLRSKIGKLKGSCKRLCTLLFIPGCFWYTLRKLDFYFLPNWMEYDRGDSFLSDFEPNGFPFCSKSNGKLSPRSYPIQFERKWKSIFPSVRNREIASSRCTSGAVHYFYSYFIHTVYFLHYIFLSYEQFFHST